MTWPITHLNIYYTTEEEIHNFLGVHSQTTHNQNRPILPQNS